MVDEEKRTNEALDASKKYNTVVEEANDYIEHFDILETITNVGNDEVFTPRKTCDMILDSLPEEVWHNPLYKWLNPATKNGIFEREIALRLDKGLENVIADKEERRKHILQNMIFSIGQTKFTSNVARRTLYYCSQANRKCDGLKAPDGHYVNGYSIGNGSWFDDEEGNIKTPCTDHDFQDSSGHKMPASCKGDERKKYKCQYCGIDGASNYNDANQREKYAYEFIHVDKGLSLSIHLAKRFFGGNRNMKFDIIIGNPPYQLSTGGGQAQAKPIYHKFIEQAISLNPKYLCMITPSRWFAGGIGLDDFRAKTLKDRHFRKIVDYVQSEVCFPGVVIAGGVNYFLWERDYEGDCEYTYIDQGKKDTAIRKLNEFDIFIRSNKAVKIIHKIQKQDKSQLSSIMSSLSPFGLNSNFRGHEEKKPGDYRVLSSDGWNYTSKSEVKIGNEYINKYKVAISYATSGSGATADKDGQRKVIAKLFVLKPGEVCTFTYFLAGKFDTEEEANNCLKYLSTKFVRYLLFQALSGIHVSKEKFAFVPLIDFKQSVSDEELYEKYKLDKDEISLIENSIKEMN